MANAIFTTKVNPTYDDLPEQQYHFPRTYLNQVERAKGDWIAYYEPRRTGAAEHITGGRQCYFALARVRGVIPDGNKPDHFYALISDYLEFPDPVPFREGSHYYESKLRKSDGKTNKGAFGRAVREIPGPEFQLLLERAFSTTLGGEEHDGTQPDLPDLIAEPEADYARPILTQIIQRPFRDRSFREVVGRAYHKTCALTGLQLINGGGRAEIEAAHIMPVEQSGPDSPRNGIALSRTVHWMFDRHLLALEDDGRILVADKLVPESFTRLLNHDGYARIPEDPLLRPHPLFLDHHREQFQG